MTPVKFEFYEPDGSPLANVTFEIRMAKSGFLEPVDGIVMPDIIEATTNADGTVTVLLAPSSSLYYLSVINEDADPDDRCSAGGIKYKFYVPDVTTEVRVQDLIMDPPPSTTAWDEAAMIIIMDAKIASKASADAAKASELAAAASEDTVLEAEAAIEVIEQNVILLEASATNSKDAAEASKLASKASQDASRASELAAAASAQFAAGAVQDMQEQVYEATLQAGLSAGSASASAFSAATSQTNAGKTAADVLTTAQNVQTTETNKQDTAQDVVAVTALKGEVSDLKDETEGYRDEALAALGSITGVISDGGQIDLSGGAYPAKPTLSTVWRVTTGGTVGGEEYAIGDQLFYTKDLDYFYKQDGTENVHSVAGKKGDVLLVKADVGLPLVDNTSDVQKPVSNAQQTQFDLRTPTASRLDMTAGRLVKVGDYGDNGGPAIPRIVTDDANALTVSAMYAFTDGGVNVPEAVYLKHIDHETAGYAKQLAYGILTDKQYVRTQNAGVWSGWTSAVEIIDALTSTDPNKALSAKQGKVLYDLLLANNATIVRYNYTLTVGQTAITGVDLNGKTLSYVPGTPMIITKDGFNINIGNDYTASNGTLVTLITAVEQEAQFSITVFGSFTVADHYTKAEADALLLGKASQTAFNTLSGSVTTIQTTYNKLTLDAVQSTTSGTTKDFVIPTNAKRITLFFNQLSLNGSAYVLTRLGAGSLQATGYLATSTVFLNSGVTVGTFASGFGFGGTAAGNVVQGSVSFTHMGNNIWIANGSCQYSNTGASALISGSVTLTGPLDRLQVNTSTGTDVFDSGSVNVLVEI